jgi:hypothetical protein
MWYLLVVQRLKRRRGVVMKSMDARLRGIGRCRG